MCRTKENVYLPYIYEGFCINVFLIKITKLFRLQIKSCMHHGRDDMRDLIKLMLKDSCFILRTILKDNKTTLNYKGGGS